MIHLNAYLGGLAFQIEFYIAPYTPKRFEEVRDAFQPKRHHIISWGEFCLRGHGSEFDTPKELLT